MVQRIDVETKAVDSAQTTSSSIDFAGELLDLDMDFADAALIEFHYSADGTDGSGNLTNPQHDLVDDRAIWNLGNLYSQITGLTADTQYHYKVVGKTVNYNSSTSMDNAVLSEGFINDLINNNTELDKVVSCSPGMDSITDTPIAMDKILNNISSKTKLLKSNYVNDTLWTKPTPSESFWNSCNQFIDISGTSDSGNISIVDGKDGSKAIELYIIGEDPGYDYAGLESTFDFSNLNILNFETLYNSNDGTRRDFLGWRVKIDDTEIFKKTNYHKPDTWEKQSLDISSYTGNKKITIEAITEDYGRFSQLTVSHISFE